MGRSRHKIPPDPFAEAALGGSGDEALQLERMKRLEAEQRAAAAETALTALAVPALQRSVE